METLTFVMCESQQHRVKRSTGNRKRIELIQTKDVPIVRVYPVGFRRQRRVGLVALVQAADLLADAKALPAKSMDGAVRAKSVRPMPGVEVID